MYLIILLLIHPFSSLSLRIEKAQKDQQKANAHFVWRAEEAFEEGEGVEVDVVVLLMAVLGEILRLTMQLTKQPLSNANSSSNNSSSNSSK
jgi:hypothetical protein